VRAMKNAFDDCPFVRPTKHMIDPSRSSIDLVADSSPALRFLWTPDWG
jgi:hypothetical protein